MALDRLTKVDGSGISTTANYRVGVITATKFVGSVEGTITSADATFTGNVSIGGTLTYEDVTNIDSVGLITARSGIDCNGDIDVDGHTNLDNVSIAGLSTHSEGIFIPDNKEVKIGNTASNPDIKIFHQSSSNHSFIDNTTGNLYIRGGGQVISLQATNVAHSVQCNPNSWVKLYNAGSEKLSTTPKGITVGTGVTIETNGNSNFVGVSSLGTGDTGAVYLYNPDADALSSTTNDIYGWKAKTYTGGLQVNSTLYLSRSSNHGLSLGYNNATGGFINQSVGFLNITCRWTTNIL